MKPQNVPTYSRLIGCIYVFNLIVGTGALAMPKAFRDAGWLFSVIALCGLCLLSFITTTFIIEAMSISNGLRKICKLKYMLNDDADLNEDIDETAYRTLQSFNGGSDSEINKRNYGTEVDNIIQPNNMPQPIGSQENLIQSNSTNRTPDDIITNADETSANFFDILEVFELGKMAMTYFNRVGLVLFYLVICIYLYGDLAVYSAAVPLSLRDVACTYRHSINSSDINNTSSESPIHHTLTDDDFCWPNSSISRMNAYRIFLTIFVVLLCPFVFFNLSKTKLLQISTLAMRWFAFGIMFVLMTIFLVDKSNHSSLPTPSVINISQSPNFFGICVYSFMCQHSLPSLITPIRNKSRLLILLLITFVSILGFYILLCLLATFSFQEIQDLVTLNFEPGAVSGSQKPMTKVAFFQYYLTLFPVFSLSATFPILAITLRNNIKNLITCGSGRPLPSRVLNKVLYPLLTVIPPIIVVYTTHNVQSLVSFTGSYGGSIIQYVIPATLVLIARRHYRSITSRIRRKSDNFQSETANNTTSNNNSNPLSTYDFSLTEIELVHKSPFQHPVWAYIVIAWAGLTIIFVTVNHIINFVKK